MSNHKTIDWVTIKTEYITSGISLRDLAEKHGIGDSQIRLMSRKEGWVEQRKEYRTVCVSKATQRACKKDTERLAKLIQANENAIDIILKVLSDPQNFHRYIVREKPEPGITEVREKIFLRFDTGMLLDLSHALVENVKLYREFFDIPTPAQAEARRIAAERLELEKRRVDADTDDDKDVGIVIMPDIVKGWCK